VDAPGTPPAMTGRRNRIRTLRRVGVVILAIAVGTLAHHRSSATSPAQTEPSVSPLASTSSSSSDDWHQERKLDVNAVRRFVRVESTGSAAMRRSLEQSPRKVSNLGRWLAGLEASDISVNISSYSDGGDGSAVSTIETTLFARFGRRPYSPQVPAGSVEFRVRAGSLLSAHRLDHQDLAWYQHAHSVHGALATVVYGSPEQRSAATEMVAVADDQAPNLQAAFGGGGAIRRPIIMIVPSISALAGICGCDPGHDVLGMERYGRVYIVLSVWRSAQSILQRSCIVHELTHVAMRPSADVGNGAVPTSLKEGTAEYEEWLYAGHENYYSSLEDLQAAYGRGYSSSHTWSLWGTQWGMSDAHRIDLGYDDAFAVVAAVVRSHGGVAAVRRLVRQFKRMDASDTVPLTRRRLNVAFRRATGATFDTVSAEAHQWVLSGAWRRPL
jgi:hypothetical protein